MNPIKEIIARMQLDQTLDFRFRVLTTGRVHVALFRYPADLRIASGKGDDLEDAVQDLLRNLP